MLVLTRNNGQRICVGGGIVITVVKTFKDRVRLGIEAPREVLVDREEVQQRKISGLHRDAKRTPK